MKLTADRPPVAPFDWQADEDGDVRMIDVMVLISWGEQAPVAAVRDAARKLRRHLTDPS